MAKNDNFDPSNVRKYYRKTFTTRSGSHYGLSEYGKFTGIPSIEGADIMLIAGVENELYHDVISCLDTSEPKLKTRLDNLIREHGKEPIIGLHLVVSLTPESIQQKNPYGMITSPITSIE